MAESTGAIVVAAASNLAIAAAKFVGAALTGSSAMLSEGAHSIVDTANQGLLLLGIHRAKKAPTKQHPFGYGREVYFFSFVVAVLIFLGGGAYSLFEGIHKIMHPEAAGNIALLGFNFSGVDINIAILVFAICAEGYSLYVAYAQMPTGMGSPLSAIQRSKDPSLFVVVAEDTAAVGGLLLALSGILLAWLLEMPVLDGYASIGIAFLLFGMAGFLMFETHGLLIGEAAGKDLVDAIRSVAQEEAGVCNVNEILTQHLGPKDILVNLSLDIDNEMRGGDVENLVGRLDRKLKARDASVRRVFIEILAQADALEANERRCSEA